jgi:hypothetical protein
VLLVCLLSLGVTVLIGALVVASIVAEAAWLVDVGGWWMLLLYLVVPLLVALDRAR